MYRLWPWKLAELLLVPSLVYAFLLPLLQEKYASLRG
jgi:hypothetical protein